MKANTLAVNSLRDVTFCTPKNSPWKGGGGYSLVRAKWGMFFGIFALKRVFNLPFFVLGWQGWPSGESTCLPPMWPGFDFRTHRHKWIEFVGSQLCYERFSPG